MILSQSQVTQLFSLRCSFWGTSYTCTYFHIIHIMYGTPFLGHLERNIWKTWLIGRHSAAFTWGLLFGLFGLREYSFRPPPRGGFGRWKSWKSTKEAEKIGDFSPLGWCEKPWKIRREIYHINKWWWLCGWWVFKAYVQPGSPQGFMIQFDEHIFKVGWFNHQLYSTALCEFIFRWFLLEKKRALKWNPSC